MGFSLDPPQAFFFGQEVTSSAAAGGQSTADISVSLFEPCQGCGRYALCQHMQGKVGLCRASETRQLLQLKPSNPLLLELKRDRPKEHVKLSQLA